MTDRPLDDNELATILASIHVERTQLSHPDGLYGRVVAIPEAGQQRSPLAGLGALVSRVPLFVGAIVVLAFWAVLLVGLGTRDAAVTGPGATPSQTPVEPADPLTGFFAFEREPNVYQVPNDGVRDLEFEWSDELRLVAASDGGAWVLHSEPGRSVRLGDSGSYGVDDDPPRRLADAVDVGARPDGSLDVSYRASLAASRGAADRPESIRAYDIGDDGSTWALVPARLGSSLARLDGETWTAFEDSDALPYISAIRPWGSAALAVGPDGDAWLSPNDCAGLGRFDGTTWTAYLDDPVLCVRDVDVGTDGTVWILASEPFDQAAVLRVYVIPQTTVDAVDRN